MRFLLTPPRKRGFEILDDPNVDPQLVTRSLADVVRANSVLGGARALAGELTTALPDLPTRATLLDVGTGLADIPSRARKVAKKHGIELTTIGLDSALELTVASCRTLNLTVCGDALHLPFADHAVDVVMCSQVLHHFAGADALTLIREMNRVARVRVIISDIRRSWIAVGGIWLMSFPLRFHAVSRHDGVVSVMRGFTVEELRDTVRRAVGCAPVVHRRRGFRVTTSWVPKHLA
ncbi:MAG: methyltransferase domain-containing protein [Gemmatimonadaceae bacterium]